MAYPTKSGQMFTSRTAAARHDRMTPPNSDQHQAPLAAHKTVSIHHDGSKFHVQGDGSPSKEHDDIESALEHARSIFGGHEAGNEDTAMEAGGEMV